MEVVKWNLGYVSLSEAQQRVLDQHMESAKWTEGEGYSMEGHCKSCRQIGSCRCGCVPCKTTRKRVREEKKK